MDRNISLQVPPGSVLRRDGACDYWMLAKVGWIFSRVPLSNKTVHAVPKVMLSVVSYRFPDISLIPRPQHDSSFDKDRLRSNECLQDSKDGTAAEFHIDSR